MRQHQPDHQLQTEDLLGGTRDDAQASSHGTTRHDAEPRETAQTEAAPTSDDPRDTEFRDAELRDPELPDTELRDTELRDTELRDDAPTYPDTNGSDQDDRNWIEPPNVANAHESSEEPGAQLFTEDEVDRFREQWLAVQTTFVDDPQDAVRGADHLVAEVMQALAATFTDHKRELDEQWNGGGEAETEELRQALRRYRSFFNQLLHT